MVVLLENDAVNFLRRLLGDNTVDHVVQYELRIPFQWIAVPAAVGEAPFEGRDGQLIVPDRPGVGIKWDERAVTKYAI